MAGLGLFTPSASSSNTQFASDGALPLDSPSGGKGGGKHAQNPSVESRRFDAFEHRLATLEESVRASERELGRTTGFLRNEVYSLKQMTEQRCNALDAVVKTLGQQVSRAREANISYVREVLEGQHHEAQESLVRVYKRQLECIERVDALEVWRKQFSDEEVRQQLTVLSNKLQESVRQVTLTMPSPAMSSAPGHHNAMQGSPVGQTPHNNVAQVSVASQTPNGDMVSLKDATDIGGLPWSSPRETPDQTGPLSVSSVRSVSVPSSPNNPLSLNSINRPLTPKQIAANCELPEEQLLRALECASEAGSRQALDSMSDLAHAQTLFGIKLKEYERRLVGVEETIGTIGPDTRLEPLREFARSSKFCC